MDEKLFHAEVDPDDTTDERHTATFREIGRARPPSERFEIVHPLRDCSPFGKLVVLDDHRGHEVSSPFAMLSHSDSSTGTDSNRSLTTSLTCRPSTSASGRTMRRWPNTPSATSCTSSWVKKCRPSSTARARA